MNPIPKTVPFTGYLGLHLGYTVYVLSVTVRLHAFIIMCRLAIIIGQCIPSVYMFRVITFFRSFPL